MEVGKSVRRVDAFDKATGRAKYCDDLCDRSALVARVLHSVSYTHLTLPTTPYV